MIADSERQPAEPRAAIVAVAKNEGVYLHEWIAYHRVIGFDELLVYDNDSDDGSQALLTELAGYGMVTPIRWSVPADVPPQSSAYADGLARLGRDFGWVAFIDLDEYVVLPQHATIGQFLRDRPVTDALGINWRNFGSSGHARYAPELVLDRFRRCARADYGRNRRVKVLAHTSALKRPGVHSAKLVAGVRYVDVTGEPIRDGRSTQANLDVIRLNHYYTKSAEEWTWKAARGRGGKPAVLTDRKHWYPDFAERDVNDDEERDVVRRLDEVRALMARTTPTTRPSLPPSARPDGVVARTPTGRVPVAPIDEQLAASLSAEAAGPLLELGWVASRHARRDIDRLGNLLPEFTYAATAFLATRKLADLRVFSAGGVDAAFWWVSREAALTSLHHVGETRLDTLPPDVRTIVLDEGASAHAHADAVTPAPGDTTWDIVTLEGAHRTALAEAALGVLSPSGVAVLNHSGRSKHRLALEVFEQAGFRRLAFSGLGPRLARLWETSVFYRPENCLGI